MTTTDSIGPEKASDFPRPLTEYEFNLVAWILPEDRPGYAVYRNRLRSLAVIGEGRWGSGDLILGVAGDIPDTSGPMEKILARGFLYTDIGTISVMVHEFDGRQLEIQIADVGGGDVPQNVGIGKRATYSIWLPGEPCPVCGGTMREVSIGPKPVAVLAVCRSEKVLWLYDGESGINYPIPVTNFYNELMLHKQIKDPDVALKSSNFFALLGEFSDDDLRRAFILYNKSWHRITIRTEETPRQPEPGIARKIKSIFKGSKP